MHSRGRLFAPLLFILAFSNLAAAQEKGLVTGLIAGFNISTFAGEDAKEFNPSARSGLFVGAFGLFGLSENVAVQPEVQIGQKGGNFEVAQGELAKISTDYVSIPVSIAFRFPASESISPFISVGPQVSFRVSCTAGVQTSSTSSTEVDCSDLSNAGSQPSTDFSVLFGAGAQVGNALFSIRYDLGLTALEYTTEAQKVNNRVLQLTAAYGFRVRQ